MPDQGGHVFIARHRILYLFEIRERFADILLREMRVCEPVAQHRHQVEGNVFEL